MNNNTSSCYGTLKVSEDVIIDIALTAVNETEGVKQYNVGKRMNFATQPPVAVKIADGSAFITVLIGVEHGYKAQTCAEAVQERIKSSVQDMTGIMVSKVNVKIISLI